MASCLTCHTDGAEERRCADCHLDEARRADRDRSSRTARSCRARTGLGDAHGAGFANDHQQEARQVGATCTRLPRSVRVRRVPSGRGQAARVPPRQLPPDPRASRRSAARPTARPVIARSRSASAATSASGVGTRGDDRVRRERDPAAASIRRAGRARAWARTATPATRAATSRAARRATARRTA